jgi:hypothetical protein
MIPTPEIGFHLLKPSPVHQVLSDVAMPCRSVFYPLGFPVEIATNSPDVLEAAALSWGKFTHQFDVDPVVIRLGVTADPEDDPLLPPAPLCRLQGHLMSHVANQYNFISCDLNAGFAFGWVTDQTVRSTLYLRYHILEAAALGMLAASRVAALHAACVSSHGYGMLLCGDSGAGKSSLAFAGARAGWSFICDDASYLSLDRRDRLVVGNCHQFRLRDSGPILFPELEGRPITPRATGKPSIEIPTAELPGITISESATVQAIVFLNRQGVSAPKLISFPKEEARRWFHKSLLMTSASIGLQIEAIENLLKAPIYELRYTRLEWAIERLNQLAQQGN